MTFKNTKYRELMDSADNTFWSCRKQYLLGFESHQFETVEFLVWQAYQLGLQKGPKASKVTRKDDF